MSEHPKNLIGEAHLFQELFTDYDEEGAEIILLCYIEEHQDDFLQWLEKHRIDFCGGLNHFIRKQKLRLDMYATLTASGLHASDALLKVASEHRQRQLSNPLFSDSK